MGHSSNNRNDNRNAALSIFDHFHELVFIVSNEGRILYTNPAACSISGYESERFTSKPLHFIFSSQAIDISKFSSLCQDGGNTGKQFPMLLHRSDGHTLAVDVTLTQLLSGGIQQYVLIGRTETEKQLDSRFPGGTIAKLKDYKQKLQHQLDQQTLIADISQQLSNVNFYQSLGKLLEVIGKHTRVSRVYIFEDTEDGQFTSNTFEWCNTGITPQIDELKDIPYIILPSWKNILKNEGRIFSKNIRELPEDIFSVLEPQQIKSLLIFPLISHHKMIGFIGFDECLINRSWERDEIDLLKSIANLLSNAFERSEMLCKLKENELRLELAITNSREGVWDWNMISGKVFLSEAWFNMFGYEPGDFEHTFSSLDSLIHPDDQEGRRLQWDQHIKGELEFYAFTLRMLTKSGQWKWILEKGKVISFSDEGLPLRAIGKHSDVSEVKIAEEQLKIALEKEKELNDLKSRFVSNSSHEFRTPLASILITSDALKQYWTKMNPGQIESRLNSIQEKVNYLTRIVNDILEISRLKDGQRELREEQFELVTFCKSLVREFTLERNETANIHFDFNPETLYVKADKKLIALIINNLVSNAVKYSPLNSDVSIHLELKDEHLRFIISDQGIGIPLNEQKHLFEPFFRASNTEMVSGSGLGLSIVKESVDRYGGLISFESKPGTGTRFDICFPKALLVDRHIL